MSRSACSISDKPTLLSAGKSFKCFLLYHRKLSSSFASAAGKVKRVQEIFISFHQQRRAGCRWHVAAGGEAEQATMLPLINTATGNSSRESNFIMKHYCYKCCWYWVVTTANRIMVMLTQEATAILHAEEQPEGHSKRQ